MQKVIVIGAPGSGKSVFSRKLAAYTGLPLIHLDALYWKPGWVTTPKEEWHRVIAETVTGDRGSSTVTMAAHWRCGSRRRTR